MCCRYFNRLPCPYGHGSEGDLERKEQHKNDSRLPQFLVHLEFSEDRSHQHEENYRDNKGSTSMGKMYPNLGHVYGREVKIESILVDRLKER